MGLKPGYKQTEVGAIPEQWQIKELAELLDQSRAIRYGIVQPGDYESCGCLMLRSQDYSKGWVSPDEMHRVNSRLEKQYRNARISSSDLIMTIVGAGIGQVEVAPLWLDGAILSRSTARIAIDENQAARQFVGAYLESPSGKRQILNCQKEGAQPVVSCRDLAKFIVPYPPLAEQEAIAEVLSDTDGLIESLEQLIAKKRHLKQGAMQELLTGKKRLPGFGIDDDAAIVGATGRSPLPNVPHGWEVKRLGDVLKVRHGKSQHNVEVIGGKYPILASGGEIGRSNNYLYDKPSVLIGRKGTIDAPQFIDTPFWTIDTLFFTEIAPEADAKFIFYKFNTITWRSYNEASGVPSLSATRIENIDFSCPPLPEQTAIAAILSDMDAEIEALESKLAKTRQLKQGMMHNLLTGRIRLL